MLWYSMVCASVSFFRVIEFRGIEGSRERAREGGGSIRLYYGWVITRFHKSDI